MSDNPNSQVGSILLSMPLDYLMATPFMNACAAQTQLALCTADFVNNVALDENGNVKNISMNLTHLDASGSSTSTNISVPLITMVNIPCLYIQDVEVDFVVEVDAMSKVNTTNSSSTTSSLGIKADASYKFGGFKASVGVDYKTNSTISSNTAKNDSLNTKAKYSVHMAAKNQQPIGLQKLLGILNGVTPSNAPQTT